MNPRLAFAISAALLFVATPALAAGGRPADSTPPLLTFNQLGKVCLDEEKEQCGPIYYVTHDGKIYRESNDKLNLQRSGAFNGAVWVPGDSLDLLP